MYSQCPKKWALQYRDGHKVVEQSIHMTFGTALHETLQMYLDVMYAKSGAEADRLDLETDFENRFINEYKKALKKNNGVHFADANGLREFNSQGIDYSNGDICNSSRCARTRAAQVSGSVTFGSDFKGYRKLPCTSDP